MTCFNFNPHFTLENSLMKKNTLFLITIAFLSSTQAFAQWQFQGGGRIIHEQQSTTTGVIHGGIISKNTLPFSDPSTATAYAKAGDATGGVNNEITTFGEHNFTIKNTTPAKQRYDYHYQICADGTKCYLYTAKIELEPNATGQNPSITFVTAKFSNAGKYYNKADTIVSGAQHAAATHQGVIIVKA